MSILIRTGLRCAALCVTLGSASILRAQSGGLLRPDKYSGNLKVTQTDQDGRQQTGTGSLELKVISVSPSGDVIASMMAYNGIYGGGDVRGTLAPNGLLRLSGTVASRPATIEARVSPAGEIAGRYSLGSAWPHVDGEYTLRCSACATTTASAPAPTSSAPASSAPTSSAPASSTPTSSAPASSAPTQPRQTTPSSPSSPAPAAPTAKTESLIGSWSLSLPGAVSITDSRQQIDSRTVEKTSKVTVTTSQAGMGSLTISADGTYRLVWDSKTTTGRWDRSPAGALFPGSIRLLDAHPQKHWDDRNWYVFVKDDGEKEARFPPHTGYDAVRLRSPK